MPSYSWTLTDELTSHVLPGEVDTIKTLVEDPPLGDLSIRVRQAFPLAGGRDAALDQLGDERGLPRDTGESDQAYRARISALPDIISPDAISRACKRAFDPYKGNYLFFETWDIAYQTCWDAPSATIAGSGFNTDLFVYDDPAPAIPFVNRWLDENDHRGGFIVVVENVEPIRDHGWVFDDTIPMTLPEYVSSKTGTGLRAVGAWDADAAIEALGFVCGAWDGYDDPKQALYKGLYTTIQNAKAAGVAAALELLGE